MNVWNYLSSSRIPVPLHSAPNFPSGNFLRLEHFLQVNNNVPLTSTFTFQKGSISGTFGEEASNFNYNYTLVPLIQLLIKLMWEMVAVKTLWVLWKSFSTNFSFSSSSSSASTSSSTDRNGKLNNKFQNSDNEIGWKGGVINWFDLIILGNKDTKRVKYNRLRAIEKSESSHFPSTKTSTHSSLNILTKSASAHGYDSNGNEQVNPHWKSTLDDSDSEYEDNNQDFCMSTTPDEFSDLGKSGETCTFRSGYSAWVYECKVHGSDQLGESWHSGNLMKVSETEGKLILDCLPPASAYCFPSILSLSCSHLDPVGTHSKSWDDGKWKVQLYANCHFPNAE